LILALIRKLFPLRYSAAEMSIPIAELQRKYRKYSFLNTALFFLLYPVCGYASYLAIRSCAGTALPDVAGPIVAIRPGDGIWAATAMFPGITLTCCLIALIDRLLLGVERSRERRILSNRRAKMDATRMFVAMGILMTAGSLLIAFFAIRSGLYLGRDQIALTRIFSWQEERYSYPRIKALREEWDADNGKWDFTIQFDGAQDWSTSHEVVFPDDAQKALLSQRSGKPIRKVAPK